jgi:hypothetical protein
LQYDRNSIAISNRFQKQNDCKTIAKGLQLQIDCKRIAK